MPFTRVGDLLTKRRNLYGPEKRMFDAVTILNAWPAILESVKCVEKFQRTRVLSFKNGALTIQAASSTIASELKMCESKILAAYAKRFKGDVVTKLLIRRG